MNPISSALIVLGVGIITCVWILFPFLVLNKLSRMITLLERIETLVGSIPVDKDSISQS